MGVYGDTLVQLGQDEDKPAKVAPSKQPVWGLRSVLYHQDDMKTITTFADKMTENSNDKAQEKAETYDYMYDTDEASAFKAEEAFIQLNNLEYTFL